MMTFSKTMFAAAAVLGTASMAQAGFYDGPGRTTNGYHTHSAACADGTCETGDCVDGSCGHGHCADGNCGVVGRHSHNYPTGRVTGPTAAVPRPVSAYGSTSTPYYSGYRPAANCPGGVCPTPQRSTTLPSYRPVAPTTYRPAVPSANCPNGNCPPSYVPQPQYRATGFNLFGMRF